MPVQPMYPGIFISELPSSTHTITAAPTAIAVFVGYTHPFKTRQFGQPVQLFGFADFERYFGGFIRNEFFDTETALFGDVAQAVSQFFLNGGTSAWVVGLQSKALQSAWSNLQAFDKTLTQESSTGSAPSTGVSFPGLTLAAGPLTFFPLELSDANHQLEVMITNVSTTANGDHVADVTISYNPPPSSPLAGHGGTTESYVQVSAYPFLSTAAGGLPSTTPGQPNPNYILTRINGISELAAIAINPPGALLQATAGPSLFSLTLTGSPWGGVGSGAPVLFQESDFTSVFEQGGPLDALPMFNLLVIPGVTDNSLGSILASASAFCAKKRAFLIMDPPRDDSADGSNPKWPIAIGDTMSGKTAGETIPLGENAALYFPYLTANDPVTGLAVNPLTGLPYEMPPSGTVAGVFARTDLARGVWKSPAGLAATLVNVTDVVERGRLSDPQLGLLNQTGVNCIRTLAGEGLVVWGARTSISANTAFQQWKYISVRRMALFLEQSLLTGLGWVVFEPNAAPLWASIESSTRAFMLGLYNQGAFSGSTASEAFQVRCDSSTTTQNDIDNGIVNIVVAFAPLLPAEFTVIQIARICRASTGVMIL